MSEEEPTSAETLSLATLLVESGPCAGQRFSLSPGRWSIGRAASADVSIADPEASRLHARLIVDLYGVTVEDLGSKNGVQVDGVPVVGFVEADDGAQIELGGSKLRLKHHGRRLAREMSEGGEVTRTTRRARAGARALATADHEARAGRPRPLWPLVVLAVGLALTVLITRRW